MPSGGMNGVGGANQPHPLENKDFGENEFNPFAAIQAGDAPENPQQPAMQAAPNAPLPRGRSERAAPRQRKLKGGAPPQADALVASYHNPRPERHSGTLKNGDYRSSRMKFLDKWFGSAKSSDALHAMLGEDLRKHFSITGRGDPYGGDVGDHNIHPKNSQLSYFSRDGFDNVSLHKNLLKTKMGTIRDKGINLPENRRTLRQVIAGVLYSGGGKHVGSWTRDVGRAVLKSNDRESLAELEKANKLLRFSARLSPYRDSMRARHLRYHAKLQALEILEGLSIKHGLNGKSKSWQHLSREKSSFTDDGRLPDNWKQPVDSDALMSLASEEDLAPVLSVEAGGRQSSKVRRSDDFYPQNVSRLPQRIEREKFQDFADLVAPRNVGSRQKLMGMLDDIHTAKARGRHSIRWRYRELDYRPDPKLKKPHEGPNAEGDGLIEQDYKAGEMVDSRHGRRSDRYESLLYKLEHSSADSEYLRNDHYNGNQLSGSRAHAAQSEFRAMHRAYSAKARQLGMVFDHAVATHGETNTKAINASLDAYDKAFRIAKNNGQEVSFLKQVDEQMHRRMQRSPASLARLDPRIDAKLSEIYRSFT